MSSKKRQQTFAKLKREQEVRERRERKQQAKKAARDLKAAIRDGTVVPTEQADGAEEAEDVPAE